MKQKEQKNNFISFIKNLARLFPLFLFVSIIGFLCSNIKAYAAGNIYGACADMAQTQAVCTDDPCGTGVATNYTTMQYNGNLSGNTQSCSHFCCTNTNPTLALTPTATQATTPTIQISPSITPTATPSTFIALNICPHGLGNCGDNVSPNIGGNTHPKHLQRPVSVGLFNGSDQQVASITGTLEYSSSSAKFLVTIPVPSSVPSGSYLVKLSSDGFLTKQVPGIIQLTNGQTVTIPVVSLVTGNINNDSQIDILDYNLLTNCFGSKQTTSSCTTPPTASSSASDINDDGVVDAADYNLFLRELSVQKAN